MSIYNKKFKLPKIKLAMPQIPIPNLNARALGIALILIIILATIFFIASNPVILNNHILISWTNNPLSLTDNSTQNAELHLTLINTSKTMQNISLEVTSNSQEIIIFCPDNEFPNVASGNRRETACVIRKNPAQKVFSGTYEINIKTNLGEATTSLEIRN
ncbi:MAG: hypothetical protein WC915_00620 [archaeon]|jgi:hypothetical protein